MPWTFDCAYPGVANVRSFSYVTSLGISPGVIDLACHPLSAPAGSGAVAFGVTDGTTTRVVTLPDCRLASPSLGFSATDVVLRLQLYDRRWRWAEGFPAHGHFNQQDDHRKLVPWSVRSPFQIAVMLLTHMGEPAPPGGWQTAVDLPGGLAHPTDLPLGVPPPHPTLDLVIDPADDYLKAGTDYTRSRTNPVTVWTATPAAVALAQYVEQWGRAVCLDPLTNAVSIVRLGTGTPLPAGRRLNSSPSVSLEAVPASVTAVGAPTRFQRRFRFRAVGREWDGSWAPLDRLSYAPVLPPPQKMRVLCRPNTAANPYDSGENYVLVVNGVRFTAAGGTHSSESDVVTALAAAIAASTDPRVGLKVAAVAAGVLVQLTALADGYEFKVRAEPRGWWELDPTVGPVPPPVAQPNVWAVQFFEPTVGAFGPTDTLTVTVSGTPFTSTAGKRLDQAAAEVAAAITAAGVGTPANASAVGGSIEVTGVPVGTTVAVAASATGTTQVTVTEERDGATAAYGWHRSAVSMHPDARPTGRLSYEEARAAARECVHRTYQLVCEEPGDPDVKALAFPTVADPVTDRHHVLLLSTRVEQVQPRPGDAAAIDPRTGVAFAEDTYGGYSMDRRPAVFASASAACWGGVHYRVEGGLGPNTTEDQQVYVPYQVVDPLRQVIQFDRPLFRVLGQGDKAAFLPAEPVVEVGCHVCDPVTLTPIRLTETVVVPGGTAPPVQRVFEDVAEEVIQHYDPDHTPTGHQTNDTDPRYRAALYATETALKYQQPVSETVSYNNVELIPLDGLVRQVEWRLTAAGPETTASANGEFSRVVPPYGERRRRENLPPDAQRAVENVMSHPANRELPRNAAAAVAIPLLMRPV